LASLLGACSGGEDDGKKAALTDTGNVANPVAQTSNEVSARGAQQPTAAQPVVFSALELAKVLDVGALPAPSGTKFGKKTATSMRANVPGNLLGVADFYREALRARGWEEVPNPRTRNTDEYASFQFAKAGHVLALSVSTTHGSPSKEPAIYVSMTFHGNFDTRTLPTPEGKQELHASQTVCTYIVEGSVAAVAGWVQKTLADAGWQPYAASDDQEEATGEHRTLTFRKQGYALMVLLGVNPVHKKTYVQYLVATLAHELPAPANATRIVFNDDEWTLSCEVPGDLKAGAEFYKMAMPAAGYTPLASRDPQPGYRSLRFGTAQGDIISVRLSSKDGQPTKVHIECIPAAVVAKMKNQDERKPSATPP
jgi:hypothetical protein